MLIIGKRLECLRIQSVSEHMGWVRNVVLMNVYFGSGKPQGVGISGRGGARWADGGNVKGQFASNPRKKWTDPVTARKVSSKWKGEQGEEGEQGEQADHCVHNLSILCI